ncbi:GNAT family N-acetyltransferase [Chloroflexota bacterium]
MNTKAFQIRPVGTDDRPWVTSLLEENWGSAKIVTHGRIHKADELPGFIAVKDDKPVGLITHSIKNGECEITSMNSLVEGIGIGSALVESVRDAAIEAGCRRVWAITTNDNTAALRFWQKRGFSLVAVYPNAIEESRKLKPEIGRIGDNGIPIRDEIELELSL